MVSTVDPLSVTAASLRVRRLGPPGVLSPLAGLVQGLCSQLAQPAGGTMDGKLSQRLCGKCFQLHNAAIDQLREPRLGRALFRPAGAERQGTQFVAVRQLANDFESAPLFVAKRRRRFDRSRFLG